MSGKQGRELALSMLRVLPRVTLANIRDNPGSRQTKKRGRAQHGGDYHGAGNKGSGQRQNYMRPGYETGNNPFYLRFGYEPYYKGHHLRRQYPPLSLSKLQQFIDTNRIDASKPIDLAALLNTGLYHITPHMKHAGVHLTDEGADEFQGKVNIEVQWASEPVIAAIERNGGVITTTYYDQQSLHAVLNPRKFFEKGEAIPRRMLPPMDCLEYYSSAETRGYLADPEKVCHERLVLAQKYGYNLPKIEEDPQYEMLSERKDPRQIFYGLEPGWVVVLKDKAILKPKADYLKEFYQN
ncbi:large ribosomal subunit protein uL15m [Neodiprion pinetum]|uniref:Large ribosomal subunit protein uL15m n=1 Tax=Neodiprion lecontei TaxID=441921 RepID=A0A6J0B6R9_NEOLC|nr:39S ribosomal protein L15, mitochondrial [Neodiprion lecontei]XP_046413562.1 39S ribosomal protein L15, mitochondrial [Neodiprion fabricii]XP_046469390.1 39S ribosomal protein L15, mitochondrial [Neodiprion pinetum]XP_046606725.1 39S ribosomal protein L15, mitochondrial [Neodiprion virginianus]